MPNLKEVRNRITSVNSTRQITSAMKMVSAAKLKKAQDAITQMRPYAEKLSEILSNLSTTLDASEGVYAAQRDEKKVLIVAVTSNRGLCGAFNANINKSILKAINGEFAGKEVDVLSVGKKAFDVFKKTENLISNDNLQQHYNEIFDQLDFEHAAEIAQQIMDSYANEDYDRVVVVYNKFKNAAVQEVMFEQFLPIVPPSEEEASTSEVDYLFEPSRQEILDSIIPKSLKTQFYKALLDSYASEHGARMTAMHKATDNAGELLKELKLSYNKARQAAITNEILEIVSGAEALNG
ncbi:MAG: ATP synthase F1 subunit gamma [Crocinitomicaceae bacterium]|nr:ATP synthase F1 subunit gamma [Crocinitomicaceae bacterium]